MESATRRAERSDSAPVTSTVMKRVAPSPSRATSCASSTRRESSARRKARSRGSAASSILGAPAAVPVAKAISVSLVEVSPSIVRQLKLF
jgi:hypothetical protein